MPPIIRRATLPGLSPCPPCTEESRLDRIEADVAHTRSRVDELAELAHHTSGMVEGLVARAKSTPPPGKLPSAKTIGAFLGGLVVAAVTAWSAAQGLSADAPGPAQAQPATQLQPVKP